MGPSYQGFYLPKEMKTKSMGGVSKKVIGDVSSDMIMEATTTATEYWRKNDYLFTQFSCKLNREQIIVLIRSNKTYNQITVSLVNPPLPGTRSSSPSPPIRPYWSFRASPPCRLRCKSDDLQWTKNHKKQNICWTSKKHCHVVDLTRTHWRMLLHTLSKPLRVGEEIT